MALFPNFDRWKREYRKALEEFLKAQQQKPADRRSQSIGGPRAARQARDELVNEILRKLGPLGQIVGALLRPNGQSLAPDIQKELEAAQALLASITESPKPRELVQEPQRVEQPPDRPTDDRATAAPGDEGGGPLVEGPILVRSSNVYSIAFEWGPNGQPGNLLVRFLGGTGKHRAGPGSLYRYFDVPRAVFTAFKRAASKGGFVWDELRVRGSVSGHQYNFELAGTDAEGYVPRAAGLKRGERGEFFMQRSYQGRRSNLPERKIGSKTREELTPRFKANARSIKFRRNSSR